MQNLSTLKFNKNKSGITFCVKVIPNSSLSKIVEINSEFIKIKLNSPPLENRANKETIKILADAFKVSKTSLKIVSGDKNKQKTISCEIDEIVFTEKLNALYQTLIVNH